MATQTVPLGRAELSVREKLQALKDFLQWTYETYERADAIFRDCHLMLRSLQVGEKTMWGPRVLAGFMDTLSSEQIRTLQQEIRKVIETFPPSPRKNSPLVILSSFPRILLRSSSESDATFVWLYAATPGAKPDLDTLKAVILCRVVDLLDGLYLHVLVRCETCMRLTVRGSGRDKTYCSVLCRVKASQKKRLQTLREQESRGRRIEKKGGESRKQ